MTSSLRPNPPGAVSFGPDAAVIGLVGLAHMISHFSQLLLAPLFPWLREAFNATYTELGFLMTVFFVVSCTVQTLAGFLVDRHGPRPILMIGVASVGAAAFGFAASPNYWTLALCSVVAGMGNGMFHPANYTLLNRKVSPARLGHAYSVHGITGNLGWALAPAMLVPLTIVYSWRVALAAAGALAYAVLLVLWFNGKRLALAASAPPGAVGHEAGGSFAFLRIPVVWMCFVFFLLSAIVLTGIQAFAPEAARHLHAVPVAWAAMCLTVYMVCSAAGMLLGGFLAVDPERCERILASGFGVAALMALVVALAPLPPLGVPALFGVMGFATGSAGPSRDLLVKRSTPDNAAGRVYGVVYSGLDIGQALAPLAFGTLMDHQNYRGVWLALVLVQAVLIASAFNVRRVRRTVAVPA